MNTALRHPRNTSAQAPLRQATRYIARSTAQHKHVLLSDVARLYNVNYGTLYSHLRRVALDVYEAWRELTTTSSPLLYRPEPVSPPASPPSTTPADIMKASLIGAMVAMQVRGFARTARTVSTDDMEGFIEEAQAVWEIFVDALGGE